MRRVYRAILVPHRVKPKVVKWELLFTCYDASDIDDRLKELGLTRADVIRCRS